MEEEEDDRTIILEMMKVEDKVGEVGGRARTRSRKEEEGGLGQGTTIRRGRESWD
jgi:hypothetical protein